MFEIVNTNTFDCHFIFFISPFQTHCFRNFNAGVCRSQTPVNFNYHHSSEALKYSSIKVFLPEILCHDSCWFLCLYKTVFPWKLYERKKFLSNLCVEFSFRLWNKKVYKMLPFFVIHRNKFRKYSLTFIHKESSANVL